MTTCFCMAFKQHPHSLPTQNKASILLPLISISQYTRNRCKTLVNVCSNILHPPTISISMFFFKMQQTLLKSHVWPQILNCQAVWIRFAISNFFLIYFSFFLWDFEGYINGVQGLIEVHCKHFVFFPPLFQIFFSFFFFL